MEISDWPKAPDLAVDASAINLTNTLVSHIQMEIADNFLSTYIVYLDFIHLYAPNVPWEGYL